MLVLHWTRHNNMDRILRTGLTPQKRVLLSGRPLKGIWCYPFNSSAHQSGNWRRVLKNGRRWIGNLNGIVFRLEESDFPLLAGDWASSTHQLASDAYCRSFKDLQARLPARTLGENDYGPRFDAYELRSGDPWRTFEIVLLKAVPASRFMRVIKDRPGRRAIDGKCHQLHESV